MKNGIVAWPMGSGTVATAVGEGGAAGCLIVRAVPDSLQGKPGADIPQKDWERIVKADGPAMVFHFQDEASVDRLIATLYQVKRNVRIRDSKKGN